MGGKIRQRFTRWDPYDPIAQVPEDGNVPSRKHSSRGKAAEFLGIGWPHHFRRKLRTAFKVCHLPLFLVIILGVSTAFQVVFAMSDHRFLRNKHHTRSNHQSMATLSAKVDGEKTRQSRTREGFHQSKAITPSSCKVDGQTGHCMFVWECMKTKGTHLGMCMDGFMFGSCCIVEGNDDINKLDSGQQTTQRVPTTTRTTSTSTTTTTTTRRTTTTVKPSTPVIVRRPTRPSRPVKPTKPSVVYVPLTSTSTRPAPSSTKPDVRWPPSAPLVDKISTDKVTEGSSTYSTNGLIFTRPTKVPPSLKPGDRITTWRTTSSVTSSTSSPFIVITSPYFPDSAVTKESLTRPTRPTRPPRPSPVTYFPGSGAEVTSYLTTRRTTPSTTTRRTTRTTTTTRRTTTTKRTTTRKTTTTQKPSTTRRSTTRKTTFKPIQVKDTADVSTHNSVDDDGGCGIPQVRQFCASGRIVNGTQSCYGQFPWQVSVRRTSFFGFSSTHRCGGALINQYWVATAGHCVDDLLLSKIRIRIGEWDFSSTSEPHKNVERKVTKKIVHPDYNFFTYENDLALLKLEKRVNFQDNIIPICLPANDDLLVGEMGTVAGWGRLSEGGSLPSILQYVSVPIVSNDKCQAMFLRAGRHEVIPDIFMCAGYDTGGRDSCQGDSGGPLVVKGASGRWFLGGIISWGIGCAEPNLPGVCTRISKFRSWILDKVT